MEVQTEGPTAALELRGKAEIEAFAKHYIRRFPKGHVHPGTERLWTKTLGL